jgi:hypothetical protein
MALDQLREVIDRIGAAWREKRFVGLEACFHEQAVITGPGFKVAAKGRGPCAERYREFASNAQVLAYTESGHELRQWGATAVYTYAWEMTWRRDQGPQSERGTDQLVFQLGLEGWEMVWRNLGFESSPS